MRFLEDAERLFREGEVADFQGLAPEHLPEVLREQSAFADVDVGLALAEDVAGSGKDYQVFLVEDGLLLELLVEVAVDGHVFGGHLAFELGQAAGQLGPALLGPAPALLAPAPALLAPALGLFPAVRLGLGFEFAQLQLQV